MDKKHNAKLTPVAKKLRKNMTKEERRLWYDLLRDYPVRFFRQKVLGRYIVDFYCAQANLVIELDGSQHYQTAEQEKDAERTAFLEQYGLCVVRIPNNAVNENFRGVCCVWSGYLVAYEEGGREMICWELFYTFLMIGAFTFGGGYAMLPLIQEQVAARWGDVITHQSMIDFVAVSESTPGPFAINMATYVGSEMGGVFGAFCATLGVVLPSFVIILIVAKCDDKF